MIYIAVRDHHWTTAHCRISDEKIQATADRFDISYTATYTLGLVKVFEARVSLTGRAGVVEFAMRGAALADFSRNRIGICVHHPIRECAGKIAGVTRPDGSSYSAAFPELIAPHQPFLDIQQMTWLPAHGIEASLTFAGDTFETEDQRNWGDACYKTYSTPLSIPFPVQVKKGDVVEQSVTLRVKAKEGINPGVVQNMATISFPFPKIGLQAASRPNSLSSSEAELLKKVSFQRYRVEVQLNRHNWQSKLEQFFDEARRLNTVVDLIVFFAQGSPAESEALLNALKPAERLLHSLLVLKHGEKVTPAPLLQCIYPAFKAALPSLKIGYGTDAYFTELNRNRPAAGTPFDFVSFSVNPQVHASDIRSIMENVEALPWIVKTARSFARGSEVFVSPFTLKKRNNPDAGGDTQTADRSTEGIDHRQTSSFFATFTLLAVAGLAEADAVVLSETVGGKGIMAEPTPAEPTRLFPVYELLASLRGFGPVKVRRPEILSWGEGVVLENEKGELLKVSVVAG